MTERPDLERLAEARPVAAESLVGDVSLWEPADAAAHATRGPGGRDLRRDQPARLGRDAGLRS
jgi:hypothetical protein